MKVNKIEVGLRVKTARRTITEADIVNFAGLSNDFNPLHMDEIFAREHHGRRIAHGQMIAAIVTGLRSQLDRWPVVSYVGIDRKFVGTVGAGDTIWAEYEVTEMRSSASRPGVSIVKLALEVKNQDEMIVSEGHDVMLVDSEKSGGEA